MQPARHVATSAANRVGPNAEGRRLLPTCPRLYSVDADPDAGMTWDVILGYSTGLRFFAPDIDAATLLRTLLVINLCQAGMCRLLAHNNGHPKNFWTIAGFIAGVWAVAILILMPARGRPPQ